MKGATGIALGMGISQSLVGLTMVAIGSSVPDLATSLIAALKNRPQIAFGNIVGACGETGACWDSMGVIKQCQDLHFRAGRQD